MLLRGGYYPGFGIPHAGLEFAPEMISHSHGSTAITGTLCKNYVSGTNLIADSGLDWTCKANSSRMQRPCEYDAS
jgi:hypothetical protein